MPPACLVAVLGCLLFGPVASAGASVVSVAAPTTATATVSPSATVALTGASVSDSAGSGDQVLITVSTGSGTVSFSVTSGLTLATGYSSFTNVGTVAFQGTVTNVNAALASMTYTAPAQTTSVSVSITATSLADAGNNTIAYDPATGHFYEYVSDSDVDWLTAQTDANSMTFDGDEGYLATIPNAAVSSFVEQHLPAHDVWAGGESFDYPSGYNGSTSIQRVWVWADGANEFPSDNSFTPDTGYYGGPLAGEIFTECGNVAGSCAFTNQSAWNGAGDDAASWIESTWNGGEPNNSDSYGWNANNLALGPINGEHYLELNTGGGQYWNDLSPYQYTNGANIQGYVVEFGNNWGTASTFPDGQGTSSTSLTVANAPGAPTGITADAISSSGGQATVSWSAPMSNGGSAITGYDVTATPGGETCTTTSTSCTVSGLTDGTDYTFAVRAVNAAGDSTADTSSSVMVIGAPLAPTGLSAVGVSPDGGQVTLSWTAPADGGSLITGYTATASPGGGYCTTTSTSCTIVGLIDGNPYSFVVTASNAAGTSAASNSLTVTPSAPAPPTTSTGSSAPPTTSTGSTAPPTTPVGSSPGSTTTTTTTHGPTSVALVYDSSAGSSAAGSGIEVSGHGFAPGSLATVTMHSVPVKLGTVQVDSAGQFEQSFKLPPDVPAGIHHIEITGTNPSGNAVSEDFYFQVSTSGTLMRQSAVARSSQPNWPASAYVPALHRTLSTVAGGGAGSSGETQQSGAPQNPFSSAVPGDTSLSGTALTDLGSTPSLSGVAANPDATDGSAGSVALSGSAGSAGSTAGSAGSSGLAGTAGITAKSDGAGTASYRQNSVSRGGARRSSHSGRATSREIGGVRYPLYNASSPAHAQQTGDTEVAMFTLLGVLALGGGLGAATGGYRGVPLLLTGGDGSDEDSEHQQHSKSGNTLSSAKVKHLKFRHEATAIGDRSATWISPMVDRFDALSLAMPTWLNRYSPLAARLTNDGAYARAMVGTRALILPILGLVGGIVAALNIHGAAIPPAFWLVTVIVVISTLDASAGFFAAVGYTTVVVLLGGVYGAAAVRTLLAVDVIFFAGTLAASASRPLRRKPASAADEWYDRAADFVVGGLIGMWAISKMVNALSAIAGVSLPIASRGDTLALIFGAAMLTRYLLESSAARWYPARLAAVAPPKLGFPSPRQQVFSALIKTAVYVFFADAYIGWAWELYVGAALFFIPSVVAAYQMKLPNLSGAVRWMPAGVIKVVLMLVVGKACASLLYDHVSSKALFVDLGFVLLGLPSLLLGLFGFFAREGETFSLNWTYRFGGAGLVVFGVLVVQGIVPIK